MRGIEKRDYRAFCGLFFRRKRAEILPAGVLGVLRYAGGREIAACPAKLQDLGGVSVPRLCGELAMV